MRELQTTLNRLTELSRKAFVDPHTTIVWPEALSDDSWTMSPELLSIYGSPVYENMTERQRQRLALYETINFFSLNIHGEKALIEGLSRRLYDRDTAELTPYIHHFLDEENKHMQYFGGFCQKYVGKIYPEKKLPFSREYAAGEEDFLFFVKVMIFEEIVDAYNVIMARDARLVEVARQINLLHHQDETRHLAFGRLVVRELYQRYSPEWSKEKLDQLRSYIGFYLKSTWREYYNPAVYRDAGIADPYEVHAEALESERSRAHRVRISDKCVRYLKECGILTEEPTL